MYFLTALVLLALSLSNGLALAQDFSSGSFIVRDPVIGNSVIRSTSDGYQLYGAIGEISLGTSTSAAYGVNAGFLFFPFVTTPVVTATAGQDAQVPLSWTASSGFLGWTVTSYIVGQSTASGGPYSYANVGNNTSSTRTGLTNGTTYYFVVRPADTFGNGIATSTEVSAAPAAAAAPPSSGGGGGGGGGYIAPPGGGTVNFSGKAYPNSKVFLLKDAQVASIVTASGVNSEFSTQLSNLSSGTYLFTIYSEDYQGRRSSLLSFPVAVSADSTTNVTGIFVPPTIALNKSEVKKGDPIKIFGQATHQANINITVNSEEEYFVVAKSDAGGVYNYDFNSAPLEFGDHFTKSQTAKDGQLTIFSPVLAFKVGNQNVAAVLVSKCPAKGDVNGDCRVNLVDFSIVAYWWKRPLTATAKQTIDAKLWPDGAITLRDFSIMAYYWTG